MYINTGIFRELLSNYTYFSEFIYTNTHSFRELLPNYIFFSVRVDHY